MATLAPWCKISPPHRSQSPDDRLANIRRYWDWTLDVKDVAGSDFWDPVNGVGGNGGDKIEKTSDGREWKCLVDGPFKDIRLAYSRGIAAEHCLSRDFYDGENRPGNMRASAYTPEAVADVQKESDFKSYEFSMENGPHIAIHSAVGGLMGDLGPSSSPNGKYHPQL